MLRPDRVVKNWVKGDKQPPTGEAGATGTYISNGIISETGEYLTDFTPGDTQRRIIEKMRRSDGQVKAGLLALTLPIQSAHWDIQPVSGDNIDLEVAAFVRENLFEGMSISWGDFLRQVLLMLPFGFSVFEKVWELSDKYRWRKLAPRLPQSIAEWYADENGGLTKVVQRTWKDGKYEEIPLSAEKVLVFTHEKEGSNFQGVSCLRAAYKHWYFKNTLYAIDGMAAERHGIGVPHFTFPKSASKGQKESIKTMGEHLHAHQKSYIATPEGITFDIKGVAGQLHDIKSSIEHHDTQILRSILAQFIALAGNSSGSYALSADQSTFFLMALKSTSKTICETMNTYGIPQLVSYNFPVTKYPKLTVSDLHHVDVAKLASALVQLGQGGFVRPDDAIEAEVRRLMRLPSKTNTQPRQPKSVSTPNTSFADETGYSRELTDIEQCVAFKDIDTKLDKAEDVIVDAVNVVKDKQVKKLVKMAVADIKKGDITRLGAIDVPYRAELAKQIQAALVELYSYGEDQVTAEAKNQGVSVRAADSKDEDKRVDPRKALKLRALAVATVMSAKLKNAMTWEALNQMQTGRVDEAALTASLMSISDKDVRQAAGVSTSEAFNLGRTAKAQKLENQIVGVKSSAILDKNTCEFCREMDQRPEWKPNNPPTKEPPYSECDGRTRCRCLWVYRFGTEVN